MHILIPTALSLLIATGSFGQTADSTKAKPKTSVTYNPNAQRNGYETYQSTNQIVGNGSNSINTIDNRYEGLRGTPYFLNEWNKGLIEMNAGQNYKDVPIKFDAYRQHLILKRPWQGGDSIIVNADQVKSFQLSDGNGQLYVFRRYPTAKTSDELLKEGYFMVLYQGKSSLLKRIVKSFKQADYKNPYSTDTRYDEFRNNFSYYLLKPDQTLEKVKLSDKSLIEAIGDRKDELKAFARQENLTIKSENDAVKLIQKYDSL